MSKDAPRRREIADLGMIGDGRTAAIVDRDGCVVWTCWPRFDSAAIFASLVGSEDNGEWRIAPAVPYSATRRYRPETLILETRFETQTGVALLTDFMPYGDGPRALVRRLIVMSGEVEMALRFAPRSDSGRTTPPYRREADRIVMARDDLALTLVASRPGLTQPDDPASVTLRAGERVDFALMESATAARDVAAFASDAEAACERYWRAWASRCAYDGPWRSLVLRSLITLKAMIYAPTGGIVAAPTSSLPERMGGSRNWDYRFCWLRDSTFTVLALLHAGYGDEAGQWVNWLLEVTKREPHRLKVYYGVEPGEPIEEFNADWLSGFHGSRPVRFGNAARDQLQLGCYGEVQDALHQWRMASGKSEDFGWKQQRAMLGELSGLVGEPDSGIWEQRGHHEAFTQSRAMAWVAFDRALRTAKHFGFAADPGWSAQAARLHAEVCERGFDKELGAFTRAYGSRSFDGSCLLLPMVGFLPPEDPRIVGTLKAIRSRLADGPFVYRYDAKQEDDGVGGKEGAFLACSYWLADNLILMKQHDAAAAIFEDLAGAANDLGLMSEEYGVSDRRLLGNFPQALTHLSLVHTALNLAGPGPAKSRSQFSY